MSIKAGFLTISSVVLALAGMLLPASAGAQIFDFDSAPIHVSLPIDQTVGAMTAHLSATGQGFSIQPANQMGFTPAGFGGLCIYPNSIDASDLLVSFSSPVTDFSMMYAPQELGCDSSAIMRVTAYMNGVLRGWTLTTAPAPGTWPTGTLSYSDPAGFNQVVVHYDRAPVCGDYGTIFMADNMIVTAMTTSVPEIGAGGLRWVVAPNPFRAATELRLSVPRAGTLMVSVHDVSGRLVRTLVHRETVAAGSRSIAWDGRDDAGSDVGSGIYFCHVATGFDARVIPMVLLR